MVEPIKNLLVHAGASWVLWFLFGLSAASVAVMVDRARVFFGQRDDISALVTVLHRLLGDENLEGARAHLGESRSAAAQVALAGLAQWERGSAAAREAMAAATGLQRARMERRLLFLGTVGNNAPFIGLLGTVIGVVGAFEALGMVTAKLIVRRVELPVDLPRAKTGNDTQEIFSIVLGARGATQVNGTSLHEDDEILPLARTAEGTNTDLRAVIKADGDVPHRRVMHVLDLLRQAGVAKVGFGVEPIPSASAGAP